MSNPFFNPLLSKKTTQTLGIALGVTAMLVGGFDHAWAESTLPASAQSGVNLYNKGLVAQSLNVFKSTVKRYPSNALAYTWLGKAYKKQGGKANQALASQAFETALELDPTETNALKELAELYSWTPDKRAAATGLLQQYVSLKPQDHSAKKQLAMLYIWQGQYDKATPYVQDVQGYYQNDTSFLTAYAQYLTYGGRPADAVELYEGPLKAHSANASVNLRQAYVAALVKSGQTAQARTIYRQMLSASKTSGRMDDAVLSALAGMAFELGDYEESLSIDADLLQSGKVDAVSTAMRMARSYQKLGHYEKALTLFQELNQQGRLDTNEKIEYADVLTAAMKDGTSGVDPSHIEAIYREALKSTNDKVGLSLRLARLYASQADESANAVNYFIYAAERDASGEAKVELIDFLKSLAENPAANTQEAYSKALNSFPNDPDLTGVYAEFLSWNEATRPQALEHFLKLAQNQPKASKAYAEKVEQTLVWHQAKRQYLSWYEQLGEAYPTIQAHKLAMARAYWQDKSATPNMEKACMLYNELLPVYGKDPQFISEYSGMLSQSPDKKMKARGLALVEGLYTQNPEDLALTLSYAKQLSYSGKQSQAIKLFNKVLSQSPQSRDALVSKANAYLWNGENFQAIKLLNEARQAYPNDIEVLKSLAEAYKAIGRYDKALDIIKESKQIRPITPSSLSYEAPVKKTSVQRQVESPTYAPKKESYVPSSLNYNTSNTSKMKLSSPISTDMVEPEYTDAYPLIVWEDAPSEEAPQASELPRKSSAVTSVESMDATLATLQRLQQQSNQQLDRLHTKVNVLSDLAPGQSEVTGVKLSVPTQSAFATGFRDSVTGNGEAKRPASNSVLGGNYASEDVELGMGQTIISDEDPAVGNHVGGRGDLFQLDKLAGLNRDIKDAMRPSFRTGFLYTAQDGEDTTNKLRHWVVPNQISFNLTPNVRMRAGYAVRNLMIPAIADYNISPRSTMAHQYSLGTSFGITDKLSFDGDASLENYTQSKSVNVNYQARLQYQMNDRVKFQVGSRRSPLETSFLSYAGFKPINGALAGELIGQVRETSIFAEANLVPWKNWDLNMAYEFAVVDGRKVQRNTKNQVYASLGYNWQYAKNHAVRLAYESLFFGYAKNATLGFYNQFTDLPQLVSAQAPLVASPAGYVLGGYYSPDTFFLNDVRVDFRGSCLNKFIEYKLGGSIGVQNQNPGIPGEPNATGAAYSGNGQLTFNINDAVSVYGVVDYLDTGGVFSRWRLGGGLIYRPAIRGMMPVIGAKVDD